MVSGVFVALWVGYLWLIGGAILTQQVGPLWVAYGWTVKWVSYTIIFFSYFVDAAIQSIFKSAEQVFYTVDVPSKTEGGAGSTCNVLGTFPCHGIEGIQEFPVCNTWREWQQQAGLCIKLFLTHVTNHCNHFVVKTINLLLYINLQ